VISNLAIAVHHRLNVKNILCAEVSFKKICDNSSARIQKKVLKGFSNCEFDQKLVL